MFLVFDIGGTKIRLGVSGGETIDKTEILETEQDFNQALEHIKAILPSLTQGQKIEAASGGVPGVLNPTKTSLIKAKNLPLWENQPIKEKLQEIIGAPVFLENDAAMDGLGEAVYGAGNNHKIVGFITVGTGVGGCRILNQQIDENVQGFEPGKQIISLSPQTMLEDLISGRALETKYGTKPETITDPEVWDNAAKNLAVGLNNAAVFWSPNILVIGGSVTNSIPIERVESYLREFLTIYPSLPEIKKASLGDLCGLYGGLSLLKQKSR